MNLRGAFIFRKSLILISQDWLVYDVPHTNIESYGKMLFKLPSVPIERKWPAFGKSKRFRKIKDRIANIYSVDKVQPLLYMDVYYEVCALLIPLCNILNWYY